MASLKWMMAVLLLSGIATASPLSVVAMDGHVVEGHPIPLEGHQRYRLRVSLGPDATHSIEYATNDVGAVNPTQATQFVRGVDTTEVFLDTNYVPWTVPVVLTVTIDGTPHELEVLVQSPPGRGL